MSVQVSCPACGGPVVFKTGTAVVSVCPYCRSVVARGDQRAEDLGKVAAVTETDSPLAVGLEGRYGGVPFHLTGRVQLGHAAGGTWDEWYAAFADGRWGWLAEAQGRFYLTFREPHVAAAPAFGQLRLGQGIYAKHQLPPLTVTEIGEARPQAAEGEIPYRLEPDTVYSYADLSGPRAEFATLDYSETPPLLFVGRELELDELGFPAAALARRREARHVEGLQLACPHCGGALELRAPDKTLRVTCPNCGSLLDAAQGQLRFLAALAPTRARPAFPLGAVATFEGDPFTLIGFVRRSVEVDGVRYHWDEYLLYHPVRGFRWLVQSDGHWNYVRPLPPGRVHTIGRRAVLDERDFKLFQENVARVDHVLGEFYWRIHEGEEVAFADYVHPPDMLSRELAHEGAAREISWSLGTYTRPADIEAQFGVKDLPRPSPGSIAPNQPFPYSRVYAYWGMLAAAALLIGLAVMVAGPRRPVFAQRFTIPNPGREGPTTFFSPPLEVVGRRNIQVTAQAPVDNSWVEIEGDLVNEETGLVQSFTLPIEYYHGVDGGESWTEGSRRGAVYLSALPAGKYTLRLEFQRQPGASLPVDVTVREGVPRLTHWLVALAALSVFPAGVAIYHVRFTRKRWEDSPYSPFHSKN